MRVDLYLVHCGKFESRSRAKAAIIDGKVKIDSIAIDKSSVDIDENFPHEITVDNICPYVSRGGLKLEFALEKFSVCCEGKTAVDIGASTGGFTDCLLQHGALRVYAFDNGEGQMHRSLAGDKRVINREKFNARLLCASDIPNLVDIAVMDVSFISQTHIIKNVFDVLVGGGVFISLIKPQFEVTRADLNKRGIVKDEKVRESACERVVEFAKLSGFSHMGTVVSPICGGDGNIEYLACFVKNK